MADDISLNTSIFCSLARQGPFQEWLSQHAPDLLNLLRKTIAGGGCRAVRESMKSMVDLLQTRGQFEHLISFLLRQYPYAIRKRNEQKRIRPELPLAVSRNEVFSFYNDKMLTYPRRMMICDDNPITLKERVRNFVSDKLEPDFLIVNKCAYIEYFVPQDREVMPKIARENRELYRYRERMKQCANV